MPHIRALFGHKPALVESQKVDDSGHHEMAALGEMGQRLSEFTASGGRSPLQSNPVLTTR